jgi:hypothetical protein
MGAFEIMLQDVESKPSGLKQIAAVVDKTEQRIVAAKVRIDERAVRVRVRIPFLNTNVTSKRTSLCLMRFYQTASGTNSTGAPTIAEIDGSTNSSSSRQAMVMAGILRKV